MWVIRARGETYYVNHVICNLPWSTKEAPNNSNTKGSIKFKKCLIAIDDDNCANITTATAADILRIKKKNSVRLITSYGDKLKQVLANIRHAPIKKLYGRCGSEFFMVDLFNKDDLPMLILAWPGKPWEIRAIMPNEAYYDLYDSRVSDAINIDDYEDLYE
jgi:hypothetical protein